MALTYSHSLLLTFLSTVITCAALCILDSRLAPVKRLERETSLKSLLKRFPINRSYEHVGYFLKQHGLRRPGGKYAGPLRFLAIQVVLAATFLSLVSIAEIQIEFIPTLFQFEPATLLIVPFLLGFAIPVIFLLLCNHSFNKKLPRYLLSLYHSMLIRIESGLPIEVVLQEAYLGVRNKRLYQALSQLSEDIYNSHDLYDSLDNFSSSFNNESIASLCLVSLATYDEDARCNNTTSPNDSSNNSPILRALPDWICTFQAQILAQKKRTKQLRFILLLICSLLVLSKLLIDWLAGWV